eukprot:UN05182
MIRSRKIECNALSSRHYMYWDEIFTYNTYEFNAKLKEIEALKNVTFERIKEIYETKFLLKNKPKCIINQIWKQQHNDDESKEKLEEKLQNVQSLDELKKRLCNDVDLKLTDICFNEIDDIISWQKSQTLSASYL